MIDTGVVLKQAVLWPSGMPVNMYCSNEMVLGSLTSCQSSPGPGYYCKIRKVSTIKDDKTKETLDFLARLCPWKIPGCLNLGCTPSADSACPMYSTCSLAKPHLLGSTQLLADDLVPSSNVLNGQLLSSAQ